MLQFAHSSCLPYAPSAIAVSLACCGLVMLVRLLFQLAVDQVCRGCKSHILHIQFDRILIFLAIFFPNIVLKFRLVYCQFEVLRLWIPDVL